MVLVGWLTAAILCRRGRFPQVVVMMFLIASGIFVAWCSGKYVQPMLSVNIVALAVCITVAFIMRENDRRVSWFIRDRAEALRDQRALIARELHDTLARANTQMVLRAQQAKAQLGDPERVDQVAAALEDIIAVGHQSVTDLRTMLRVLREENAVPADAESLSADLPGGLERAEHDLRAAGLHPTIACEGDPSTLAPSLAITMVRILDEAVANMIKYAARDARCSVQLDVDDEQVGLLAINPLTENRQSTPATSSGLGLLGIRERAQSRGGNADVISDDHQWILHVAIPLNASVPSTP
jgi:putative two-component histidine kinase